MMQSSFIKSCCKSSAVQELHQLQYKTFTSCTASLQGHRAQAWHMCISVNLLKYGCVRSSADLCKPAASVDNVRQQQTRCSSVTNAGMHRQTDKQTDQRPCKFDVYKGDGDCRRTRCGWAQHKQNANSLEPTTVDRADPQNANVYVGNVSPDMSEADIRQHFGQFGCITDVKIHRKGACIALPPQHTQLVTPSLL